MVLKKIFVKNGFKVLSSKKSSKFRPKGCYKYSCMLKCVLVCILFHDTLQMSSIEA